jgi:hypothetical protein
LSVPLLEMPPIDPSDGQAGPVVDNGGQPGGVVVVLRQKLPSSSSSSSLQAGSREKDKSTKRKSNLNRALTDEQVLATGQIESQGSFNSPSSYLFLLFIFIFYPVRPHKNLILPVLFYFFSVSVNRYFPPLNSSPPPRA